jgi:hypothetical protein
VVKPQVMHLTKQLTLEMVELVEPITWQEMALAVQELLLLDTQQHKKLRRK